MICNSQRYILLTILSKKWFLFHLFDVYFSIFQDSKDDFSRLRPLFKKVREKSLNWRDFYPKTVQISFTWTFHILREAVASHVVRGFRPAFLPHEREECVMSERTSAWEATVHCRSRVVPIFRERVKSPPTIEEGDTRYSLHLARNLSHALAILLICVLEKTPRKRKTQVVVMQWRQRYVTRSVMQANVAVFAFFTSSLMPSSKIFSTLK